MFIKLEKELHALQYHVIIWVKSAENLLDWIAAVLERLLEGSC